MKLRRAPSGAQETAEPSGARPNVRVVKRSIVIAGHRTSVSLEDAFWRALKDMAAGEGKSVAALVARVDAGRGQANLSSSLRVFVLERVLDQVDETLRRARGKEAKST